ncbi:hypothetical protein [Mycolicibacterium helvum]|uniref:Uncharacterized protein n=1 Tax=Mycolicibacterium helvum TaxID=1534349 RepID=A0A7I7T4M1_9MYCO|nr:hypothetical protein [Mycolicibacterium helvum]BBY63930.1 hypothetical protein MHEL_21730 [Mycolicibacterium helvum]
MATSSTTNERGQITPVTTASSPELLHLSGGDGEVFVTAIAIEDTQTQRDLLGDQITAQVLPDWSGRPWADLGRPIVARSVSPTSWSGFRIPSPARRWHCHVTDAATLGIG